MVEEYHTSSSVSILIYHLVWVTKYRNKVLDQSRNQTNVGSEDQRNT